MSKEPIYEGIKHEMHGLKDPGNVLLVVYILLVFFLLLFAGLESARADLGKAEEGTFSMERKREMCIPAWNISSQLDHFHLFNKGTSKK